MASYRDAAAGWQIYRSYGGAIARDELNQLLQAQGYQPIADRSMTHYRKLARLGYEEYISINRLDLKHSTDSVFDITDRSRYEEASVAFEGVLFVPTARHPEVLAVPGVITRFSEGFATFRLHEPNESVIGATRSIKYNKGVLRFAVTGFERAVQIAEALEVDGEVEALLTFRSLLSADLLFPDRVGPITTATLTLGFPEQPTLHSIVTSVQRSFDLFESVRGLVETLLSDLEEEHRPIVPAPRVARLQVGSPLVQDVLGSPLVWVLVGYVIKWLLDRMKTATETSLNLQAFTHAENDEQRADERHALEMRALQLNNLKAEFEVRTMIESIDLALLEQHGIDLDDITELKWRRLGALKDQAIEAGAELTAGRGEVSFETEDMPEMDEGQ